MYQGWENGGWSFRPTTFCPTALCPRLFHLFFLSNDFGPISKKKSLVKGTLTLNPLGQKDVDEMLLNKNWDKFKVKTFLRSLLFRDKNQKFQTDSLLFGYGNQKNQDKFKVKTLFFRDDYSAVLKQNQLLFAVLELKSLPTPELNL